jgi:hypothetical protein
MAIPRTGSRTITVGAVDYRWTVRDRATYHQAIAQSHLTVAVESADGDGQTLHVTLPAFRCDNWLAQPGYIVTPGDLARWIPLALARGWTPARPGPTFKIVLGEGDVDPSNVRWPAANR